MLTCYTDTIDERETTMQTYLQIQYSDRVDNREVTEDGREGRVTGKCPSCKAEPFRVICCLAERVDDTLIRAGSKCCDCGESVGWVYHHVSTVFGLEEDARVLHGRPRVY